jgi:branched-chain amino acid transport system substrate-binding protein
MVRTSRGIVVATTITLAGLGLAACGSSDSGNDSTADKPDTSALGVAKAASGDPVVIASINMEGTPAGSFQFAREAEEAAVKYVNEYLGGIHGRPLKLETCTSDGSPATSANCATRLLEKKPVAFVGAADLGTSGSIPVIEQADLAFIGGVPFTPTEQNSPNSIQFIGQSNAIFAAIGKYASTVLKAKSAGIFYYDLPVGKAASDAAEAALKAGGTSDVNTVSADPSAADISPNIAALGAKNPDVLIVQQLGPTCVSMLQTKQSVAPDAKILTTDACSDQKILQAAGSAAEGTLIASDYNLLTDTSDKDVQTYLAAVAKYQPDLQQNGVTVAGFSTIMNVWATFNKVPDGELTTKTILDTFRSGTDNPNFMAHPYTCNGAVPSMSSVCNFNERIGVVKDGKVQLADDNWYDGLSGS